MRKAKILIFIIIAIVSIVLGVVLKFNNKKKMTAAIQQRPIINSPTDNQPSTANKFEHPVLKFSFQYPESFELNRIKEEIGETLLAQDQKNPKTTFQIFILPFDEPGPLTPERIKRDLPEIKIETPKYIEINGIKGLTFYGLDQDLENTYEVWFVYKEKLYQITTYKSVENLMIEILKTWRFK